jgi:hypothetical protein
MPLVILPTSGISVTGATAANLRQPAGSLIVSGTPSGFAGPWAVETQTLQISYVRVPTKMGLVSGSDSEVYSLSGNSVRTMEVRETGLRAIVFATYSKVKDYNTYTTSGHQQPQRFGILADADQFGDTYGAGLSSTTYLLGPAGTVFTSQPYMRRVAWDDDTDVEVSAAVAGANFLVSKISDGYPTNASKVQDDFNYAIFPSKAHAYIDYIAAYSIIDDAFAGTSFKYPLAGKYGRSKETDARFIAWMDNVADAITHNQMYRSIWLAGTDFTVNSSGDVTTVASTLVGMDYYDKNVHQY